MATGDGAETSEDTIPDYDKDIYNFDQQTGINTFIKCNTTNTFFGKNKSTS